MRALRSAAGGATEWSAWLLAFAVAAPFGLLVVQAAADRWYGRSLVPQEFGARGIRAAWSDPTIIDGVTGSLGVALVVAAVAVPVAWPAARYLADHRSPMGWALVVGPILVPPLLLGDGLAAWFLRFGLGGGHVAMVLAHLVLAIPYAVLVLVPAFDDELDGLDRTAAVLGSGPFRRTVEVLVPAAARPVAVAAALAFIVSWSQYATSLTVGGGTPMLPLVLVPFIRSDPQIAAVLTIVFLVPPVAAVGSAAAIGRRP